MLDNPLSRFLTGLARLCKDTGLAPTGDSLCIETDHGLLIGESLVVTPDYACASVNDFAQQISYNAEGQHLCERHGCFIPSGFAECEDHTEQTQAGEKKDS